MHFDLPLLFILPLVLLVLVLLVLVLLVFVLLLFVLLLLVLLLLVLLVLVLPFVLPPPFDKCLQIHPFWKEQPFLCHCLLLLIIVTKPKLQCNPPHCFKGCI